MAVPDFLFHPPVIAHRGVRAEAPENTLAAFKLVPKSGAQWIEVDVKITHDGVPVLMHDDSIDRTTNGRGMMADINWSDVQKLDAGSWFDKKFTDERVPKLGEAMRFMIDNKLKLNLELKPCPGRTQATTMVALIEASKVWPDHAPPPLISSFDMEALTIAAQLHPDWPRGVLLEKWADNWVELIKKTSASFIGLDTSVLTQKRVAALVEAQIPVLCFTVNDPLRAKELLHWGVSAVFSDNPAEIIKAL